MDVSGRFVRGVPAWSDRAERAPRGRHGLGAERTAPDESHTANLGDLCLLSHLLIAWKPTTSHNQADWI